MFGVEVGGLSQNVDTADAGEGRWRIPDKMLTILKLGSRVGKWRLREEIKRQLYK